MNFNLNKTMLLMGACTALGLAYSPCVHAASPSLMAQAVQQAKKVTGHVVDVDGLHAKRQARCHACRFLHRL